jgi:phosphatidylethanolamine-binding protein (PEBP) family uncharacterized protein
MGLAIGTYDGEAVAHAVHARRRRRSLRGGVVFLSSAVLSIALAGCGEGVATTPRAKPATIAFTSPSLSGRAAGPGGSIPARYTCDGTDTIPSFKWGAVPPNTAAVALFLLKVERTKRAAGGGVSAEVKIEWAVAGLSPGVHEIPAGKLPQGVAASSRYSICPTRGSAATYIFQLVAMSQRPELGPRFDATRLFQAAESSSLGGGTLTSSYKRT